MGDRVRQGSLASQLQTCLRSAPTDIMDFIEACTMGNVDRVEKLIEKGVVSILLTLILVEIFYLVLVLGLIFCGVAVIV